MPQPIPTETSGAAWKRPPELNAGTIRQLAAIDREQRRPLPPRRHEPICFKPMVEDDAEPVELLEMVVAILAIWIIVAVVIVSVAKS